MNKYQEHGFKSRKAYLIHLSKQYDVPLFYVMYEAATLGEHEDFSGLVAAMVELSEYSF